MKYEFTGETKVVDGRTLKRIRALTTIAGVVMPGECGGWIEKEANLTQVYGDAWVSGHAWPSGDAWAYGDVWVYSDAQVSISPIVISGMQYTITVSDSMLDAGCPLTDDDYSPFGHKDRQQPWGRYVYFNLDEAITNLTDAQWKEYNDMCVAIEHYKDDIAKCKEHMHRLVKQEVLLKAQADCHEHLMKLVKDYWVETKKRLED